MVPGRVRQWRRGLTAGAPPNRVWTGCLDSAATAEKGGFSHAALLHANWAELQAGFAAVDGYDRDAPCCRPLVVAKR